MEEWKLAMDNIEISNYGNIRRNLGKNNYKIINGSILNCGYKYFQLMKNKKKINYLVHQLVAKLFIGEPENYGERKGDNLVIDHLDRNKLNNHVSNLRYCTHSDNMINSDRITNAKYKSIYLQKSRYLDKVYFYWVVCYKVNNNYFSKKFKSQQEAQLFYDNFSAN